MKKRQIIYDKDIDYKKREIKRWINKNIKKLYAFFSIYI